MTTTRKRLAVSQVTQRSERSRRRRSVVTATPCPPAAPSRRRRARTVTGRSEADDPGALGIQAMQEAAHTDARAAFDRFDALSKASEAARAREAGVALLAPPPGRVLRAHGEAMVPDLAPGNGVPPTQRAREFAMLDTLECPDMVAIGASQLRLEALATLGLLQPAMDAATTVQAANSIEKMLSHQFAALHHHGMRLLARAVGADELGAPDPVMALRIVK